MDRKSEALVQQRWQRQPFLSATPRVGIAKRSSWSRSDAARGASGLSPQVWQWRTAALRTVQHAICHVFQAHCNSFALVGILLGREPPRANRLKLRDGCLHDRMRSNLRPRAMAGDGLAGAPPGMPRPALGTSGHRETWPLGRSTGSYVQSALVTAGAAPETASNATQGIRKGIIYKSIQEPKS